MEQDLEEVNWLEMEGGRIDNMRIKPPKDSYNLAYIVHFILGAGNLLPWNALIAAVDYFNYLYPQEHVDKVFSVAYMGSSLAVLVILMSWSNWSRRPSIMLRMNLGFSLFVVSLLAVPVMDWTEGVKGRKGGYSATVVAVAVCGLADGLVGGSLIGSAGELPKRYMQAVFAGTACSGVLLPTLRIITKASLPQTCQGLRSSAHLYFILSALIVIGCIICCNVLDRLQIIRHHRRRPATPTIRNISIQEDQASGSTSILCTAQESNTKLKFWVVWKRIRCLTFGIVMIYVVTLSIFPGYITENVHSELLRDWYPILLITTYNVSDLLGKCLTATYVPNSTKKATWACILRLVFYPVFAACLHGPKFFRTELPVIFSTSALGLTNGYLTSVLMILAPKSVPETEAETAGVAMALFLGIGLAAGSVLGWFWII